MGELGEANWTFQAGFAFVRARWAYLPVKAAYNQMLAQETTRSVVVAQSTSGLQCVIG